MEPYNACLAHLQEVELANYLATLSAGSDIDHRGTEITSDLLNRLLNAVRDPISNRPTLGKAALGEATFIGDAIFDQATFSGNTVFRMATFSDVANFEGVTFSANVNFKKARFSGNAVFRRARFSGNTWFIKAAFSADAWFFRARFSGNAEFSRAGFSGNAWFIETGFSGTAGFVQARFSGNAVFIEATFSGAARFLGVKFFDAAQFNEATFSTDAKFSRAAFFRTAHFTDATFEGAQNLGPIVCLGTFSLTRAHFSGPATIDAAATQVDLHRSRWDSTATLRLRYANVNLADAVWEYPVSVTARPAPAGLLTDESLLTDQGHDPRVRITSITGVDATHLVLAGVDISDCTFVGAFHLDQIRLEGRCDFAVTPAGWHRGFLPRRWTPRITLTEEQHWRAAQNTPGWTIRAPENAPVPGPAVLAQTYRHLRKALEDGKNEPDAADFYYGECEMRRHDLERPTGERVLLHAYWALSGYGLRASRALIWLLLAMTATILAMMLWGLPQETPSPHTTGTLTHGRIVDITTDTPDPVNPTGPYWERLTSKRWEKSLDVVTTSVIFRSSGHDLTTTGNYIEKAARFAEPTLLVLAILAIRGRLKR